jgi:hypothetical protein
MNGNAPTIAELRARVQKNRYREIGNWLARCVARPTAIYGCWVAVRLGLSAHQVSLIALGSWVLAAVAIGTGDRYLFILGAVLVQLGFWFDHVDGQVARWRGTVSLDGVYLDYMMHHAASLLLGFALGYGLAARFGDSRWAIAGFAIAAGWAGLSLHNDCRYKAFFQRLKSTSDSFRVDGGAGGRPEPPFRWPRHGRGALTWPAFKLCEFHVVASLLSAMAVLALVYPGAWALSWQALVIFLAVLAPSLAIGRTARAVNLSSAESEYARWFQSLHSTGSIAGSLPAHRPLDRQTASE